MVRHEAIATDDFYERTVVAAVDLLGMQDLLGRDETASAAMDAIDLLVRDTTDNDMILTPAHSFSSSQKFVYRAYFADSAYLFADPTMMMEKQTENLLLKCGSLIAHGLRQWVAGENKQFLARVGIASGNVRWRRLQWLGENILIPIGTAMSRSYKLATSQQWIGGAIERDLIANHDRYRLAYDVPTSRDHGPLDAINWVQLLADNDGLEDVASQLENAINARQPDDESSRKKYANTCAFVEHAAATAAADG